MLVGSLAESYKAVPPGGIMLTSENVEHAFARVGWALSLSIRAAAPVALALIMAGVSLGLLGRAAPSLQWMSLALPIRIGVGLIAILLGLSAAMAVFTGAFPFRG